MDRYRISQNNLAVTDYIKVAKEVSLWPISCKNVADVRITASIHVDAYLFHYVFLCIFN